MSSTISHPPDGLKDGYRGGLGTKVAMTVIFSIALYNALELVILLFITFRRYTGLYFWSLTLSTVLGVIPHAIGFILLFFNVAVKWVGLLISTIGWYFMVPGQSFVLYSRLHLIMHNPKLVRAILVIITISTAVLIIPVTTFTFSTVYIHNTAVNEGFNVMERFQVTYFCVQEILLSTLYIWETIRLFKLDPLKDRRRSQIKYELLAINSIIIVMDIVLLVMEFINWYIIQTTLKTAVYSIKLKLEFGVLSRLVSFVKVHRPGLDSTEEGEFPTFVNPSNVTSDVTHAPPLNHNLARPRRIMGGISTPSLPNSRRSDHVSRYSESYDTET